MRLEVLNVSKYRKTNRVGDDVPLVLPGCAFGIFDGATDPRGTIVEGVGAGRLAALTLAAAVAELAAEPGLGDLGGEEILARLTERLDRRTRPLDLPIPPSTTMAVAFDCGDAWRFVIVGDTGLRLNGTEILRRDKPIDDISTEARIRVFSALAGTGPADDRIEDATRRAILLGLDQAVEEGVLSGEVADHVITSTIRGLGFDRHHALVERFLRGGIKIQQEFANDPSNPLGFDTLNGTLPRRGEWIDVFRPKAAVRSIEVFTDGYPLVPSAVSVEAWENAFMTAEEEDVHKIGKYPAVKGSTSAEFFDDRTVIVVDRL